MTWLDITLLRLDLILADCRVKRHIRCRMFEAIRLGHLS